MPNGNVGTFKRAAYIGEDTFDDWARPYGGLGMKPQELRRIYDQQKRDRVYLSEHYQVAVNKDVPHGFRGMVVWWLSIKRIDKAPIMDWRDLQAIKSQLCGDEAEAIQLFPAESRVVDTSNQYHLFVFMKQGSKPFPQVPVYAFKAGRMVADSNEPGTAGYVPGARQEADMSKRTCGSCTLCCRLLPTEEIGSKAGERCPHQCSTGCRIYLRRPMSCELWNCRWLVDDDTHDQPRPDRSGIVLDIMPDIIGLTPEGESERHEVQVIVAWVDPARRDAHRSPAFRKYVERQTVPVLVRYSSSEGFVIFPPSMTGGQGIVEHESSKSGTMDGLAHRIARQLEAHPDADEWARSIARSILDAKEAGR